MEAYLSKKIQKKKKKQEILEKRKQEDRKTKMRTRATRRILLANQRCVLCILRFKLKLNLLTIFIVIRIQTRTWPMSFFLKHAESIT